MKTLSKMSPRTFTYLFLLIAFVLPLGLRLGLEFLPAVQLAEAMSTINVNSTLDERDASAGDGVCLSTPSGVCTLRAAIDQAGYNSGPDTIVLQENKTYKLTINGSEDSNAMGDLDIYSDITIEVANGGKATIDGNGSTLNDNVIQIFYGTVSMTGLVIQNGALGGIQNAGILTLKNVTIKDNGSLDCSAQINGGIFNTGTLNMSYSTVTGNAGYEGGGINNYGTLSSLNSTISGNTALKSGGGIHNDDNGPGNPGIMTIRSTTITLNRSNICNLGGAGGGIINSSTSLVNLSNTIVANNHRGLFLPADDDCLGWYNSLGYNLVEDVTGCFFEGTTTGNIYGVEALLGNLQINGGLTATHSLLAGSPAIDSGNVTGCKDGVGVPLPTDQRGAIRHIDGGSGVARCDIGAYELFPFTIPPGGSYTSFIPFVSR